MHRFIIQALPEDESPVELPAYAARQVARVLRLREGERIALLDGSGREVVVRLTRVTERAVTGIAEHQVTPDRETRLTLEIVMGLPRHDRWELVLQKVTELGVVSIQPVEMARCAVRLSADQFRSRRERWERIIIEAVEQSGRTRLPVLQPLISLPELTQRERPGLALHTVDGLPALGSACSHPAAEIRILVGPEGGLDECEAALLAEHGWRLVSLGPRTLRCETAAIVACAVVLASVGDLGE